MARNTIREVRSSRRPTQVKAVAKGRKGRGITTYRDVVEPQTPRKPREAQELPPKPRKNKKDHRQHWEDTDYETRETLDFYDPFAIDTPKVNFFNYRRLVQH